MSESEQDIGRSVRHGLALTGGADSLRHILEFTASIILARLLRPADFGIIAVVSSFMQISYVVGNFGMAGAVVQAAELNRRDMDTATVLSTSVAIALTVCMALIAPLAADFFSMQELTRVMPLMALQITLAGLASVPMALLRRDFRFGRLAVAESAAAVVYAATGITLAAHGYGVWSLVWAPLASSVSLLVGVLLLGNYRPALRFSRESLGRFWRFGGGLTLKNVFVYAGRNVDNFIVARLLGDAPTGIYNRAFNLTRMPQTRLVGLLYRVCFPAFCRLRNERERFHQWYIMATRVVAVSVTPLLLGLCAVAAEFTIGVLGEHWSGMILPLRILCISALVSCLHTLGGAAIEATGRVHYEVYTQSAYAVMIIAGCVVGARWGIDGVAWGVLFAGMALYAMKAFTMRAATGLPIRRYVGAVVPSLVAGAIMAATVAAFIAWATDRGSPALLANLWIRLAGAIAIGLIVYPLSLALVGRKDLKLVIEQVRLLLQSSRDTTRPEGSATAEPSRPDAGFTLRP